MVGGSPQHKVFKGSQHQEGREPLAYAFVLADGGMFRGVKPGWEASEGRAEITITTLGEGVRLEICLGGRMWSSLRRRRLHVNNFN